MRHANRHEPGSAKKRARAPIAAGLQKTSLIDYPGKISCVVFLTGCNFTCPFCHNPDLARGLSPEPMDLDRLDLFLSERKRFLEGVVITGGEPTLTPRLALLCRMIRAHGLSVKLDTNGSRPRVLRYLIDSHLVDYIAMDLKTAPQAYAPPLCPAGAADRIRQSIAHIMAGGLAYEFRTTCVQPFVTPDSITQIARAIQGAERYTLQTYRAATLLAPDFHTPDKGYAPEQMRHLRRLAAPFVQNCGVR